MAFRSIASASSSGSVTSIVVTIPSGLAANDRLVAALALGSADVASPPAGFTELPSSEIQSTTNGLTLCAGEKVEGTPPADYTFTVPSTDCTATLVAFSNMDTGTINASSGAEDETNSASPRNINAGTMTTTATCDQVWIGMGAWDASGTGKTYDPPSGYTERLDLDSGAWSSLSIATKDNVAANTTGTVTGTGTWATHSGGFVVFLMGLKRAADPVYAFDYSNFPKHVLRYT